MATNASLTTRQLEILVGVVSEMGTANVDWDVVAKKANCKSGKYACDQFNLIRKQLQACVTTTEGNGNVEGGIQKAKTTKKTTPVKRKKSGDGEEEDEEATPTKKKPTPRKVKSKSATPAKEKSATPVEGQDGEGAVIKDEPVESNVPNGAGEMMDDLERAAEAMETKD